MTIREWAEKHCTAKGMREEDAKVVVDSVVAGLTGDEVEVHWDEPATTENPLLEVLEEWLNQEAIKWIEANKPEAWYKALFQ